MISLAAILGVAAVELAMVLTPGPNMIYLVSRSITQGRMAGFISLGGVALGFIVYLVLTAAGLAMVFVAVPALYTGIKIAGGLYLAWLAWKILKPGGKSVFEPQDLPKDGAGRLFTMGFVTNLLNPKIAILYLSIIPQFIDLTAGNVWAQILMLGGVQIVVALAVNALIVVAAGAIGAFLARRPLWLRTQKYLTGGALGALAVSMLADRSRPAV